MDSAADGEEGLYQGKEFAFDLAIVDLGLPKLPGMEVIKRLRAAGKSFPILILTARDRWQDKVEGLQSGADDYVAKPFSVAQLVLRVQAVLRRSRTLTEGSARIALAAGGYIDLCNLIASVAGGEQRLTRREADLARYLHDHGHRPVPRDELLHKVWGYARNLEIETRTVDIHIANLRRKIEPDVRHPRHLLTVRGGGYRWLRVE